VRRALAWVALLNLSYFGIEFAVALAIGSVSLFADSIDFLEDTAINVLILVALGWSVRMRARIGMGLAALMLAPGIATAATAVRQILDPVAPDAVPLTLAGGGALVVNATCALLLARHRHASGSLMRAAYLSARNDVFANIAIIGAGALTGPTASAWPDIVVGIGIFAMNLGAAHEVFTTARKEHAEARA